MSRWLLLVAALLGGLVLASCATLSQEQCQAGDWRAIGFGDGAEGRPADYVSNHVEACSEHGISVDRAVYASGRAEGLDVYCRLSVAEAEGRAGERYYGVCEGQRGIAFARVHQAADAVHDRTTELATLDSQMQALIEQLTQGGLSEERIAAISAELRLLQLRRRGLETQLRMDERTLASVRESEAVRLSRAGIPY